MPIQNIPVSDIGNSAGMIASTGVNNKKKIDSRNSSIAQDFAIDSGLNAAFNTMSAGSAFKTLGVAKTMAGGVVPISAASSLYTVPTQNLADKIYNKYNNEDKEFSLLHAGTIGASGLSASAIGFGSMMNASKAVGDLHSSGFKAGIKRAISPVHVKNETIKTLKDAGNVFRGKVKFGGLLNLGLLAASMIPAYTYTKNKLAIEKNASLTGTAKEIAVGVTGTLGRLGRQAQYVANDTKNILTKRPTETEDAGKIVRGYRYLRNVFIPRAKRTIKREVEHYDKVLKDSPKISPGAALVMAGLSVPAASYVENELKSRMGEEYGG